MILMTPDALAAMASSAFPADATPTEADIDKFLAGAAAGFGLPAEMVQEARRLIHARLRIRMELGETLVSAVEHAPWLDARRASIDPFYWTRYRELLIRQGWSPMVVATLDQATDGLLDLMGNPEEAAPWKRRGLVVGDVQSGKTASYAALICKAADAGYRMVILLTGILENVRRQTQERLDSAFIGIDSSGYLGGGAVQRQQQVGVGLIDSRRHGIVFTSHDHDFRKNAVTALNISLNAVHEPVLVVTKKNKAVLERLAGWLAAFNADHDGRIDLPMLLIDDEADSASVNTRLSPGETTAINKAIRNLLALFKRSSYVGFTATPFANIFIDPSTTDEMLGDDLFPNDFIHVLKAPGNYVGMNALFAPAPDEEADGMVRHVEDTDLWLPPRHGKNQPPQPLPESLRTALRAFLLACAVRDLRAAEGVEGRGGGIHRSMLVNVSRFTAVQDWVADALHLELDDVRAAVRLYGALPPAQARARSHLISELGQTFQREFGACGYAWPEVLAALHDAIAPVKVQPVNQKTGAKSLDYSVMKAAPGVRVIAVGGNTLSRGLTLEGLSTSYFLRNSRAYDTLLQMGRWFGYRDGYDDLCRLWLTEEAEDWFSHITEATGELKRDFTRMVRRKATPREFGLRVRTHPDTLLITARNKMASGMDMDVAVELDVSLVGRMAESARLYSDRRRNEENLVLLNHFYSRLAEQYGPPLPSPFDGAVLWRGVDATLVADMLEQFMVHPLNHAFQGDSIAAFLRHEAARGDATLSTWTVALPTNGSARPLALAALPGLEVNTARRKVGVNAGDGSLQVSGKGARVGGRSDLRHAFTQDEWGDAFPGPAPDKADDMREEMRHPLLVTYLLRGEVASGPPGNRVSSPYMDGLVLPALGMHFPGRHDPDAPRHTVRYRLNRVAQEQLLPAAEEDDLPDGTDDED